MNARLIAAAAAAAALALGAAGCGKKESSSSGGSANPQRGGELNPKSDRLKVPSAPGVPARPASLQKHSRNDF
jgi:hypothetical protein